MDYIVPASCTDTEFRQMWAEFEWENKVSVNTTIADVNEYLEHLLSSTNMRCLTPKQALAGLSIDERCYHLFVVVLLLFLLIKALQYLLRAVRFLVPLVI